MTNWIDTFAAWQPSPPNIVSDPPVARAWVRMEGEDVVDRVKRILEEEGAEPIEEITLSVHDQHADYFTRGALMVLAEVRAIRLRNPNPFPEIVLFGRRRMASTLKGLAP